MERIGRYELPLASIVSLKQRTGWRSWLPFTSGYDVLLTNGGTLHFNEAEKQAYDKARNLHDATAYVYGLARAHGLRG